MKAKTCKLKAQIIIEILLHAGGGVGGAALN